MVSVLNLYGKVLHMIECKKVRRSWSVSEAMGELFCCCCCCYGLLFCLAGLFIVIIVSLVLVLSSSWSPLLSNTSNKSKTVYTYKLIFNCFHSLANTYSSPTLSTLSSSIENICYFWSFCLWLLVSQVVIDSIGTCREFMQRVHWKSWKLQWKTKWWN